AAAIDEGGISTAARLERADCYVAADRARDAIGALTTALRLDSERVEGYRRRARCFARVDRYEDALAGYAQLLERGPDDGSPQEGAGLVLASCGSMEEAKAFLEVAAANGYRRAVPALRRLVPRHPRTARPRRHTESERAR